VCRSHHKTSSGPTPQTRPLPPPRNVGNVTRTDQNAASHPASNPDLGFLPLIATGSSSIAEGNTSSVFFEQQRGLRSSGFGEQQRSPEAAVIPTTVVPLSSTFPPTTVATTGSGGFYSDSTRSGGFYSNLVGSR
ncbi:unnamed protein product, partial [Citrullus colocynthis]